ncbi:hypothetical protein OA187_05130 [Candidatus Pelagibacter sp.]|nr:hypothetical protein [Candidatus Pelagibacter sp.]
MDTFIVSFLISTFFIIFGCFNILNNNFINKKEIIKRFENHNKHSLYLILTILILYFLTSFIPVSDLDSLRYHLEIPRLIKEGSFYKKYTFDYVTLGSNEFINLFGLNLNFENSSSFLNVIFLIIITLINFELQKNKKFWTNDIGTLIILSSPYVLSVTTSQKLYILPCFLVIYTIIYLSQNNSKNCFNTHKLIALVLPFILTIKFIFASLCFFVVIYQLYLIKNFKHKIIILLIYFFSLIIFILPILILKFRVFGEPFIPLFLLNEINNEWFNQIRNYLLNYESKLNFFNFLSLPVKLLIPLKFSHSEFYNFNFLNNIELFATSELFKILGIGILAVFFIYNQKIKTYLILLILFLCILLIGNIQNRWFLPLLIYVGFYYNSKNNFEIIFSLLIFLQTYIIISILVVLSLLSIYGNFFNKDKILNLMSYGYEFNKQIENEYPNHKILSFNEGYYYQSDYVGLYKSKIALSFDKNYYKKRFKSKEQFIIIYPSKLKIKNWYPGGSDSIFDIIGLDKKDIRINNVIKKSTYFSSRSFIFKKKENRFIHIVEFL